MKSLNTQQIMEILPHRSPFLLVDKVIDMTPGKDGGRVGSKVIAVKNVTYNEPFFPGHFPGNPVMPGVLIVEAMAQVGAIAHHLNDDPEMTFMIAGIDSAKFKKPVVPGDTLLMTSEIIVEKSKMKKLKCKAEVDGEIVAEAVLWAFATPRNA